MRVITWKQYASMWSVAPVIDEQNRKMYSNQEYLKSQLSLQIGNTRH